MADSRVLIEIVSTAKGLKVVAKDTEKLAKNVDKVDKAQSKADKSGNKYHKQQKAIHQSNLSSAKGFSKMNETMGSGGSSGLVGAYATLAANVFAATAAFNALRTAAQVETLAEGFNFLANTSGRTSEVIAGNLKEITGNALSMEGALRASAIAITSGFSTQQMEKLAEVGKNASIALGRNLGDSIDRLIRGVAKLEPEILDELGIMVRLDTATRRYAATLGKTATELTDFERRQAFLNEAISQGENKYAALAGEIDVNPFDKLAGTFADLTHSVMTFVNVAITPLVAIFANSQMAMFGAVLFLAKGVIGTMFPVLTDLGKRYSDTAAKAHAAADAMKDSSQKAFDAAQKTFADRGTKKGDPAGFVGMVAAAKKGKLSTAELNKGMKSLTISEKLRANNLKNYSGADLKQKKEELARIRKLKKETMALMQTEKARAGASSGQIRAQGKADTADIVSGGAVAIGGAGGLEGFSIANTKLKEVGEKINETNKKLGKSQKGIGRFGTSAMKAFKLAGAGARLFGAALINAIPLIGQIIFVAGLLFQALGKLFAQSNQVGKAIGNLSKVASASAEKFEQLQGVSTKLAQKTEVLKLDIIAYNEIADEQIKKAKQQAAEFEIFTLGMENTNNVLRVTAGILTELAGGIDELGMALSDPDNQPSKFQIGFTNVKDATVDFFKAVGGGIKSGFALLTDNPFGNFFRSTTDEAAASEFKFDQFSKGIVGSIEKITDPTMKAELEAVFGEKALAARIAELTAKGYSFEIVQRIISDEFKTMADEAQKTIATIDNLPTAFEEITKKVVAFADKSRKKNEFNVMARDISTFNKELSAIATNAKGGDAGLKAVQDNLKKVVGTELIEQFENLGLSTDSLITGIKEVKDENGNITFEIEGQLPILQAQFKSVGDRLDKLKSETTQHKANLDLLKKKTDLDLEVLSNQKKLNNLKEKGIFELGPQAEMEMALAAEVLKKDLAEKDFTARKSFMQREEQLAIDTIRLRADLDSQAQQDRIDQIEAEFLLRNELLDLEAKNTVEKIGAARLATQSQAGQSGSLLDRIGSVTAEGQTKGEDGKLVGTGKTIFDDAGFQEKIQMTRGVLTPLMEDLRKLGPDGELIASIASGGLTIASSIETIGAAGEFTAEKMQAVGDIIGSIGGIMAANGKAQIAQIDKQIEAEKKRDGKSKESLAKIKAMEKQKEKIARKNFEMNKKMQIAQTIANTAAGVMKTMGDTGFFGTPLAMAVAAMGAAQVALIQKQTFQGAGTGDTSTAKPQSIQIGKRNNRVDVSQRGGAGELAFLRGESGMGSNANTFKPGGAAGMRRGYATGGEIMVGEQGPEVIQPTSSGYNVIPNDKMGGQNLNANITINAIDSAGVEEVLTQQRGNIIGMIREAAHEHGEEFIESVNTSSYGSAEGDGGY